MRKSKVSRFRENNVYLVVVNNIAEAQDYILISEQKSLEANL